MLNITRFQFKVVAVVCVITLMFLCSLIFHNWTDKPPRTVPTPMKQRTSVVYPVNLSRPPLPSQLPSSVSCTCPADSVFLKDHVPKEQREELLQRRAKEFQQHKARTSSVLSRLLFALPNSPLQYPIQGFTVRPLTSTLIPGSGEKGLMLESSNLVVLNDLLAKVSYTSTVYHINTGDLVLFQFEEHEAVFPIAIKQPGPPVLYDMGTDINSQVTVLTKTFLRYRELNLMLNSIRRFYSKITVIIADDSLKPEPVTGENIHHYIMPPAQGWFAGRNLAVSQVTTKYFLWVDDDFLFTEDTKIEKFVEVMEAVPELDVLGGSVQGNQFHFSILYEEGEEMDGGCLIRKSHGKFHSLPGYPNCFLANGVVNFFLARTDAIQKVGFDPKLRRAAHSEFFMDGLGSLMVATCGHVSIGHQHWDSSNALYAQFRYPGKADQEFKLQLHFFKNHLKCMKYA